MSATTGDFNADGHVDIAAVNDTTMGDYSLVVLRGNGQGGFPGTSSYFTDQSPVDVAAADLNGDGYGELAVSHNSLGVPSFEVHKNNTAGGFDPASYGGNGTGALVPGDFDDDGKLDVAASANGGLEVWPGQGNGSFGSPRGYATGTSGRGIAAGDFNGDGMLDAVIANTNEDTVSILLQTAAGFAPATTEAVHDAPYAVTVGDFDDDGNTDLAVANNYANLNTNGVVDILLGDGAGGFVAAFSPSVGESQDIVSGDFNHDGEVDLAVMREYRNDVLVITGHGDGSFENPVTLAVGRDPRSISVADFNEDGLDDLVTGNWYDSTVSVLRNTSRPTNAAPAAEGDSYDAPANGVLGVPAPGVLGNDSDSDCDPLTASVATGPSHGVLDLDPDGSFTYTPTSGYLGTDSFTYHAEDGLGGTTDATVSLNVSTVDAVDDSANAVEGGAPSTIDVLTNDSDTDTSGGALTITAITQPAYGSVAITGGGSELSYTPPSGFAGPDPFTYTVTDGVGRTGTATVALTVTPARGCVAADFAAPREVGQLGLFFPVMFASADFDGDGDADLASTGFDTGLAQFSYGNGAGSFPNAPLIGSALHQPEGPSFGDLNSDGRLDVALGSEVDRRIGVLYGTSTGIAGGARYDIPEYLARMTAIGDVDEDGAADVVTSNGVDLVVVMKGDGAGGLTRQPGLATPGADRLSVADIDGDGHVDLVGSDYEADRVWVMLGDGHAGFGSAKIAGVGDKPLRHVTADFDGDGALDIATVNSGSRDLSVLYGDGAGDFAPAIQLPGGPVVGGSTLLVADVNADGRPDLVTLQHQPGAVNVFLSRGAGGFAPRQLFVTGLDRFRTAAAGDFNGDGSVDIAVANEDGVLWVFDNQCATRIRPTAVHDTYVTGEDTDLEVHTPGLLGNDTYGGTATVTEQAGPSHGTLDLDPAGSFTYTPAADFNGRDTFTYKVDDGHGGTDTATVNLTVTPSEDPATPIVITATGPSPTYPFGAVIPAGFTATYAGYATGQGPTAAPACMSTATTGSVPGQYPVTCVGGDPSVVGDTANTYTFSFVAGTLTITKADQVIAFDQPVGTVFGGDDVALVASAPGGVVAFASTTPSVCSVVAGEAVPLAAGLCTIEATQAGSSNYSPAVPVSQSLTVAKAPQTISFTQPDDLVLGGADVPLVATASSGLAVGFSSVTPAVCSIVAGNAHALAEGECKIAAHQGGDSDYLAAAQVTRVLNSNKATQTITFTQPDDVTFRGADGDLVATSTSGLTVGLASQSPAICTVVAGKVHPVTAGSCTIVATQAGNGTYLPATPKTRTLTVNRATQSITFNQPADLTVGGQDGNLVATSSAGLTVSLSSETLAVCTIVAGKAHAVAAGQCTITASQDGSTNYLPATSVSKTLTVTRVATPTVVIVTAPSPTYAASAVIPAGFTPTYAGYPTGQGPKTAPICTSTATTGSTPGQYPVTCTGGNPSVAGDTVNAYTFTYVPGTLTVLAARCSDGLDNNADGNTDYPQDLGCSSAIDDTETAAVVCAPGAGRVGDFRGNILKGTSLADKLFGRGGKDLLFGLGGNDCLFGENDNDGLAGGAGNDLLDGGSQADGLTGGDGNDILYGGAGNDGLAGANGNDQINGGTGIDVISGGYGNDRIVAADGTKDFIDCGKGTDTAIVDFKDVTKNCENKIVLTTW